MLWHQILGHISIERFKRLVNDGILSTLDFVDFETCVDFINGKQTNMFKKGAKRKFKSIRDHFIQIFFVQTWMQVV